ncbi:FAD/NAD(P)-binding domain-containing protein [Hypomontagnella submonticulosa]|nr:FAD/NAD(P)-binding domain-containing protein [Hypomontagnella submonticulosa]
MDSDRAPLNVVIAGGSLAGLMCGIALKHAGHQVKIIEQDDSERMSHMSGLGLGPSAASFLQRHDRLSSVFSHRINCIQTLRNGNPRVLATGNRDITSWDAFYYRLRSNFDGYISSYYPSAPKSSQTDGLATYEARRKVLNISPADLTGSHMVLTILNLETQETSQSEADLVIGADGPDSLVRAQYLPAAKRRYVGYIVWRGTVSERELSETTRDIFTHSIMTYMMDGHHCVVYTIPGPQGSLEPGERLLNFCWYSNETREDLDKILIDAIDGHRHHNTVPAGHVRQDIWSARLEYGKTTLPAPFLEIAAKIQQPFIQVITEFCSPQAAFENGKVLLMGDALTLFRPHTALGSAQSAFHALAIEDYVAGKISVDEWEKRVLRFSFLHWVQSVWWGKFYQESIARALPWGLRYWFYSLLERIRSWRNRDGTGIRLSSSKMDKSSS